MKKIKKALDFFKNIHYNSLAPRERGISVEVLFHEDVL